MKIFNGNKVIFENINKAKREWNKIRGLMFCKQKIGMYLETKFGIHSFFVLYPLTIFICDDEWRVMKIKKRMSPFTLFFWNPKYKRVIELPFNNYKVKIGDKLEIK